MTDTVELFGMRIDRLRLHEAVSVLHRWLDEPARDCRYVVTPNVDHAVMFQERAELRAAYRDASLVLADGAPVVWASRWLGRAVPERVAGSDLTPAVFAATKPGRELRTYLLGAGPGVAERAATVIESRWPGVKVVGTYSPPMGFEKDDHENERILAKIAAVQPELLILGLGAPKQELWVHRWRARLECKAALCVGATIDFLAGEKSRAPRVLQRCGLEWVHRLASEPRRLFKRYLHDALVFPRLVWRQWRAPESFLATTRWR